MRSKRNFKQSEQLRKTTSRLNPRNDSNLKVRSNFARGHSPRTISIVNESKRVQLHVLCAVVMWVLGLRLQKPQWR